MEAFFSRLPETRHFFLTTQNEQNAGIVSLLCNWPNKLGRNYLFNGGLLLTCFCICLVCKCLCLSPLYPEYLLSDAFHTRVIGPKKWGGPSYLHLQLQLLGLQMLVAPPLYTVHCSLYSLYPEYLLIDAIHTLATDAFVLSSHLCFLSRLSPQDIYIDNISFSTDDE